MNQGQGSSGEFCRGIHTLWNEGVRVVIGGDKDDQPRPRAMCVTGDAQLLSRSKSCYTRM